MEMAIDKQLRSGKVRLQVEFAPDLLLRAGKDRFAVSSIAAKLAREAQNTLNVSARAFFLALALETPRGFAGQVFDQDCVFFVRLVTRRGGLEIETYRTRFFILKFSQFSNLFAADTHGSSPHKNCELKIRRRRLERIGPGIRGPIRALCASGRERRK